MSHTSRLSFAAVAVILATPSLSSQAPRFQHYGDAPTTFFGRYVAAAGDVNRDGSMDYIVGAPSDNWGVGSARVYSGKDGSQLFRFDGNPLLKPQLGSSVGAAGDVDRDGFPDLIVGGSAHPQNGFLAGFAQVYSGKDGAPIHTVYGPGTGDLFGTHVAGVGDIDGDGHGDFAVGAPENGDPVENYGEGYVRLFSGRTGVLLHVFKGHDYGGEFGHVVIGVGDLDQDGTPDIMIGSTLEGIGRGSARVYSGRTKQMMHNFFAPLDGDHFGMIMAPGGDVDRDGFLDVIVGAPNPYSAIRGAVWVYSGRTGKVLHHIVGSATSAMFGMSVFGVGDVDNDGHADFAGGDPMDSTAGPGRGSIRIFSGKTGAQLQVLNGDGGAFGVVGMSLGDLDGDGTPEILCGAPGAKRMGAQLGLVAVRSLRAVAPIGGGCSKGVAPRLDSTVAAVGEKVTLFVSGQVRAPGVVFFSPVRMTPTAIAPECYVHLDFATMAPLATFTTDGSGRFTREFKLPNQRGLAGAEIALQAAVGARTPAPLGTDLTNGLHLVVQ